MIENMTLQERVDAGAKFLDEKRPGWEDRIDVTLLDISSIDTCLIVQLEGSWTNGLVWQQLDVDQSFALGFEADSEVEDYYDTTRELTLLWRTLILDRRS